MMGAWSSLTRPRRLTSPASVGPDQVPPGTGLVDADRAQLESADAAVVLVDHDSFDRKLVAEVSTLVLDTRNCLSSAAHNRTALS